MYKIVETDKTRLEVSPIVPGYFFIGDEFKFVGCSDNVSSCRQTTLAKYFRNYSSKNLYICYEDLVGNRLDLLIETVNYLASDLNIELLKGKDFIGIKVNDQLKVRPLLLHLLLNPMKNVSLETTLSNLRPSLRTYFKYNKQSKLDFTFDNDIPKCHSWFSSNHIRLVEIEEVLSSIITECEKTIDYCTQQNKLLMKKNVELLKSIRQFTNESTPLKTKKNVKTKRKISKKSTK